MQLQGGYLIVQNVVLNLNIKAFNINFENKHIIYLTQQIIIISLKTSIKLTFKAGQIRK